MKYIIVNRADKREGKEKEEGGLLGWNREFSLCWTAENFAIEVLINIIDIPLSLSD